MATPTINLNDARQLLQRARSTNGKIRKQPVVNVDLRKVLEEEHPLYTKYKNKWSDYINWYLEEELEKYIFRHVREKETHWRARLARAYNFNYVQSIVDLIASFIFSKTIQRYWESPEEREEKIRQIRMQQIFSDYQEQQAQDEEAERLAAANPEAITQQSSQQQFSKPEVPEAVIEAKIQQILDQTGTDLDDLREYWDNIDLKGTSIHEFMIMIHILSQIFGHVDVFTDMNAVPPETLIETEQDRKDNNLRPYSFPIFPTDLINWETSVDGKMKWIRWREEIIGDAEPFKEREKTDKKPYRYYTWTRENWTIYEIRYSSQGKEPQVTLINQGVNTLGIIPITRFYNRKNFTHPLIGISAIKSIGKINMEVLNICSLVDEEIYQKSLNILVMQQGSDRKGSVEIGSNNVLLWEGEKEPYYLAPSSDPGSFMIEMIKMCVREIYRLAKLGGDTGVVQEAPSGIAYTWEFNQTNRMLADKADQMERGENDMHRYWAMWMGLEWKGRVDYPDDFNVERFEDEVKRVVDVKAAVRSTEFKRIMEKRLATRALAKVSPVERARVLAEIDVREEEKPTFTPFG